MKTKAQMAKAAAMRDITEYHRQLNYGMNYIPYHKIICEYAGIVPPDFRRFNGGYNRKKTK